jgi:hypothetical protein
VTRTPCNLDLTVNHVKSTGFHIGDEPPFYRPGHPERFSMDVSANGDGTGVPMGSLKIETIYPCTRSEGVQTIPDLA